MNGGVVDDDRTGRSRRPAPRHLVAALVVAVLGGSLGVISMPQASAEGGCPDGTRPDGNGGCVIIVGDGRNRTTTTRRGGGGPPPTGGGSDVPACPDWRLIGGYDSVPVHIRPNSWDQAPEGSAFYYDACTSPNGFGPGSTTTWVGPNEEFGPAPPSPADVAERLWVEVRETLHPPEVVTSPPPDESLLLNVPTFFAVSNWQGQIMESRCELGVCVSLIATPRLLLDAGERGGGVDAGRPGPDVVECDPPGTTYERGDPHPDVLAEAPGACTHTYTHRSGVGRRPATWTAEVSVAWDVYWQATESDVDGTFDLTLSSEVERDVDEIQTTQSEVSS